MIAGRRRQWLAASSATVLATALAGCGIQPTGISVVGAPPSANMASADASPSPQVLAASGQVYIYLLQSQGGTDLLVPVIRTIVGQKITDDSVAQMLIKGPTQLEVKEGFTSEIPSSLTATSNAYGYSDAYVLSDLLQPLAKAQFICTMQEYDQSVSIGYFYPDSQMTQLNWVACKDTTTQYIILPGFPGAPSAKSLGQATAAPSEVGGN
jgi:hypothetical protein